MSFVGIDLGTTFSVVAALRPDGRPAVIPSSEGELTRPSAILFDSDSEIIVGREARRAAVSEPGRVAEDVKRYMGDEHYPKLLAGRRYSPVFLSSLILKKLARDTEASVGRIEGAVVTVPAYFDESRRQATAAACLAAGIPIIDIINEPTAAALAHVYRDFLASGGSAGDLARVTGESGRSRATVVYDLGGGTFDVTLLRHQSANIRVLATAGDVRLGGRDWDRRIFDHLADAFLRAHGADPRDDALSSQQLLQTAEDLKKELSRRATARFAIHHAGRSLAGHLGRQQFEEMTADLLFRTESRLLRVLQETGVTWDEVDEVLVVGGSTRMPQVAAMLSRLSGRTPDATLSPDEAVAQGAAIHAAICVARAHASDAEACSAPGAAAGADDHRGGFLRRLGGRITAVLRRVQTTDVATHSLGVIVHDQTGRRFVRRMIGRNTALPATASREFGSSTARSTVRVASSSPPASTATGATPSAAGSSSCSRARCS